MEQKQSSPPPSEHVRSGSPLLRILIAGVALLLVIGAECAVALLIFPTAEDVAALAQAQQAVKGDAPRPTEPESDEAALLDTKDRQEVSLGEFGVTSFQPISNTTLRIDFQLYGIVLAEDAEDVTRLLEENKHRFREQVIVIMRSAELTDLTDAGLGLIKRKILEKTNRLLGRALLQEVIFSDFSFVEQ